MDPERLDHLKKLRRTYEKRLRVQELKMAQFGHNTPAEIIIEAEELREKISELDAQIGDVENWAHVTSVVPTGSLDHKCVEITLKGELPSWSLEVQNAAVRAFAAIMEISTDQVTVLRVHSGSIVVLLSLPVRAAEFLKSEYRIGNALLKDMGVSKVRITSIEIRRFSNFRELQIFADNTRAEIISKDNQTYLFTAFGVMIVTSLSLVIANDASLFPSASGFIFFIFFAIIVGQYIQRVLRMKQDKIIQIEINYEQFLRNMGHIRQHEEQFTRLR